MKSQMRPRYSLVMGANLLKFALIKQPVPVPVITEP